MTWARGKSKLILVALFFVLASFGLGSRALAWPVNLTWDPNPPQDIVTGYIVYYGTVSRFDPIFTAYAGQVDAGNVTTYTIDLPAGSPTYYVSAVAYNQYGSRSDYSNEIVATNTTANWSITASAGSNGSITPSGAVSVSSGTNQTFTITPAGGYHVANVTVDGTSVGAVTSYTFSNVTANHTIAATFAIDTFTVTASAGSNGSISPNGTVTVNRGTNQTFTITPAGGYHVANVTVDGTSVGAVTSYTFSNVTANHTIAATFAIDTFTVTRQGRLQRLHQPEWDGDGQPRYQPDLHDHAGRRLPRGERDGGRNLRRRCDLVHLLERDGQPHHRCDFRHRHLHHDGKRRGQRLHQSEWDSDGQSRDQPDLHDHAG